MIQSIASLLALLAVLLMPLAMTPAAAAPIDHQMAMDTPMGHCPDQAPGHDRKAGFSECMMACAAALPAVDLAAGAPPRIAGEPVHPDAAHQLQGLHPGTDPPPPKQG